MGQAIKLTELRKNGIGSVTLTNAKKEKVKADITAFTYKEGGKSESGEKYADGIEVRAKLLTCPKVATRANTNGKKYGLCDIEVPKGTLYAKYITKAMIYEANIPNFENQVGEMVTVFISSVSKFEGGQESFNCSIGGGRTFINSDDFTIEDETTPSVEELAKVERFQ
ncbi:MAG: hypothetical protein ACRCYT_01980 [Cetobacterium sp.]